MLTKTRSLDFYQRKVVEKGISYARNLGKVSTFFLKISGFSTEGGGGQRWVDFPLKKEEEKKGFITLKII